MSAPIPNIYSDLPEVVEIKQLYDAGEGGAGTCPHCGAIGRYIYYFLASDGEMYGAMRGCFQRFPKSKYFQRLAEILRKQEQAKRKGRTIASWDQLVLDAIYSLTAGKRTTEAVDEIIRQADNAKRAYRTRKGYR